MNEINFAMDGLSLDGTTWYNPKTGDSFKVRSNYFEDNRMKLQTTDGRMIDMETMQNYVQWNGAGAPPKGPIEKPTPKKQAVPQEIKDMLDTGDDIVADDLDSLRGARRLKQDGFIPPVYYTKPQKTDDQKMVERVLEKASQPKVDYKLNWSKFPTRQMEMLVDFMGVSLDDVCDYYISNMDVWDIRKNIKDQLREYIVKQIAASEPTPEKPKPSSKKPAPKKPIRNDD